MYFFSGSTTKHPSLPSIWIVDSVRGYLAFHFTWGRWMNMKLQIQKWLSSQPWQRRIATSCLWRPSWQRHCRQVEVPSKAHSWKLNRYFHMPVPSPPAAYYHDSLLTERWAIVVDSSLRRDASRLLSGKSTTFFNSSYNMRWKYIKYFIFSSSNIYFEKVSTSKCEMQSKEAHY